MTTGAWILMLLVLAVVWGGWAFTLWAAVRQERHRGEVDRHGTPGDST